MKPLFLDLDGPILDVSERYYRVHRDIVVEAGGEVTDLDTFWMQKRQGWGGGAVLERNRIDVIDREAYLERWLERIEAPEYQRYDRIAAGAMEALEILGEEHRVVLVTLRQARGNLMDELDRFGIAAQLETVLSASPLDGPGWESKIRLIEGHAGSREGAWMVGDTEIDVRAGKALDLRTAAVLCGIRERALLEREEPDRIVADLPEFVRTC